MLKPRPLAFGFAALLTTLALFPAICFPPSKALIIRIAKIGDCPAGDVSRDIVLDVLPGGRLHLNGEDQRPQLLGQRLKEILRYRVSRYVFVRGDPNVSFGDVLKVMESAAMQTDYVVILTSSVDSQFTGSGRACLDPNLPPGYHGHSGME